MITAEMREHALRPSFVVYVNNLTIAPRVKRCVEIGTAEGLNAFAMLDHTNIDLVCVDSYVEHPEFKEHALDRLEQFGDRVKIITADSVEASKQFPDGYFDYVYIDGGHEFDDVLKDCNAWWSKLMNGGVFAGHDWWKDEVKQAVGEFAAKNQVSVVYGVTPYLVIKDGLIPSNLGDMCDWWIFK